MKVLLMVILKSDIVNFGLRVGKHHFNLLNCNLFFFRDVTHLANGISVCSFGFAFAG